MAQSTTRRTGVWIIVGLICLAMIGFGSVGLTGQVRSIGSVSGLPIPAQGYANALNSQIRNFSQQIGTPVSFAQAQAMGIDRAVLASLISARALDAEAAGLGLSASDARVRDEILRVPAFQGLDGAFDRDTYRMALNQSDLTEAEYETSLREDIARSLLQGGVLGGVPAPAVLLDSLQNYIGERRGASWAALTDAAMTTALPAPTEAELQAFYDANPDLFTLPEVRQITYVWLSPEMIRDEVTVDPQAIRDLYDERIGEFVLEERRLVERLVFLDEAAATAAKARLDSGELTFDALVAERGLDLSDIDLGDVTQAQLQGAGEAIFAATPGEVLGPLPSSLGPALFRLNAVLSAEETPFEEAEEMLRLQLADERARRIIADSTEGVNDLLAGGATLEDLANQTDMELGTIAWTPDVTEGIAAYDDFRTAAAAAEVGAAPQIGEFMDGSMFLIRLDAITPPALQPLADVTEDARAGWTTAAARAALTTEAEALAARIAEGGGFDIPDLGLLPTVEPTLGRSDFVAGTPPDFTSTLFTMAPGEVRVLDNGADGVVIVRLDSVAPPDPTDPLAVAQRAALSGQLAESIARDISDSFTAAILGNAETEINEAAVNAVHAQFQ